MRQTREQPPGVIDEVVESRLSLEAERGPGHAGVRWFLDTQCFGVTLPIDTEVCEIKFADHGLSSARVAQSWEMACKAEHSLEKGQSRSPGSGPSNSLSTDSPPLTQVTKQRAGRPRSLSGQRRQVGWRAHLSKWTLLRSGGLPASAITCCLHFRSEQGVKRWGQLEP